MVYIKSYANSRTENFTRWFLVSWIGLLGWAVNSTTFRGRLRISPYVVVQAKGISVAVDPLVIGCFDAQLL